MKKVLTTFLCEHIVLPSFHKYALKYKIRLIVDVYSFLMFKSGAKRREKTFYIYDKKYLNPSRSAGKKFCVYDKKSEFLE